MTDLATGREGERNPLLRQRGSLGEAERDLEVLRTRLQAVEAAGKNVVRYGTYPDFNLGALSHSINDLRTALAAPNQKGGGQR